MQVDGALAGRLPHLKAGHDTMYKILVEQSESRGTCASVQPEQVSDRQFP